MISTESQLKDQENVLDFVVASAKYDSNAVTQVLGSSVVSEDAFNTFLAVDFFDHETKTTEVSEGFRPNYATQFGFRNIVDDFYLEYLDKKLMKVEVYLS